MVAVRASLPTTTSWSVKSTTLGVSKSPSALRIIAVWPDSSTQATAEKVVPKIDSNRAFVRHERTRGSKKGETHEGGVANPVASANPTPVYL